jgi:D-alanine-D-alanine ligase
MSRLKVVVLYDRELVDESEEPAPATEKSPVTRTLDKKEVEDEVVVALTKLGHDATLYELDGTQKSLLGLARVDGDLIFNLVESFAGDDTADFKIASYLELLGRRYTGAGTHGLMLAQDKAVAKKIFAFHGILTPVFAKSFRGRLDFSHDLQFPVIVKPAREDGSIGIEFSAVVSSIRELMERMDWLHANFDSPVLIEEYIEGREMYVSVLGNDKPEASLPGEYLIRNENKKFLDYTEKYAGTGNNEFVVPAPISDELSNKIRKMAVTAFKAIDGSGLARVDFFLRSDNGAVLVNEINTLPGLTDASGFPKMWAATGKSFPQLVDELIDLATDRHADRKRNRTDKG